MLWETTTTTFNTIDELDQVIHTGVNTSSPQSAGIGASQHVHLKCRAPDLVNSSSRTHYRRGLNCMEGKHLGKDSEARTKIICPVQPFQLPHPPATFKSTLAFQNLPTHHHHLKSRRSTQPYFTSLAHFSKSNQPCKSTGKVRSASISNPLWQDQYSNLKSLVPSDLNCLTAPTSQSFKKEAFQKQSKVDIAEFSPTSKSFNKEIFRTLSRTGFLEFSCSTVSTDL